jgi:SAM-dependent methyltransferase
MVPRPEPIAFAPYAARAIVSALGRLSRLMLPGPLDEWLRRLRLRDTPVPPGAVRFGDLRRLTPMSRTFGFDRGQPVDRHYIETFLGRNASDIRGRVLEVGDATYTRRFGGQRVSRSDVLHVSDGNPHATIVADLAHSDAIPSAAFDCVILTQTLHLVYDVHAAVATLRRILAPRGSCLITVPGISQIDSGRWRDSWYWAFTPASLRRTLAERFGTSVSVESFGNVLAASAFLYGLSAAELTLEELAMTDASYPVTVAARASVGG